MIRFLLISLALILSTQGFTKDLTEKEINQKYTIEMMEVGTLFLKVQVDQGLLNEEARSKILARNLSCKMTVHEANNYMLPLQALLDQQILSYVTQLKDKIRKTPKRTKGHRVIQSNWLNCESNCRCGLYASILEQIPSSELSELDKKTQTRFLDVASKMDAQKSLSCAENKTWFCESDLLVYLKKVAPQYQPDSEL